MIDEKILKIKKLLERYENEISYMSYEESGTDEVFLSGKIAGINEVLEIFNIK